MGLIDGVCSLEECLSKVSVASAPVSTPANTAPDPARAFPASAKESPMTLKEIIALARGTNPEAADALAAIEAAQNHPPVQPIYQPDPRVDGMVAKLSNMENAALEGSAEAFFAELTTPDAEGYARSLWASREGIISTFKALAKSDGGGTAQFGLDNKLVIGANLKAFMDSQRAIPFDSFSKALLDAGNPQGTQTAKPLDVQKIEGMLNNSDLSEEAKSRILARIKGGA
jgi:hypothetical protein